MEAVAVDVGVAVAGEVATSLLSKIKKHVGYLYKYKDNLKDLEDARVHLDSRRADGKRFSDDAKSRLKDVSAIVCKWQSDAYELDQKAQNITSRNNIPWLHIWSRYSSSKHAWELTQHINKKIESAPDFGTSFDLTIAEGTKFNLGGSMEFASRLTILKEVLGALKDDDVNMCSICGMGGIGKTTMAKRLVQIVEADHGSLGKVAMVTVSQNPNFGNIQNEIIELLGLKFDESSMPGRAKKLKYWLASNKAILILDDVWWQLHEEDFESVGIPLDNKGCKIVLTSRNEDECKKMGSQLNFRLSLLGDEEARDLFIQNAEKCFDDRNLQETARKIVAECDGLPIAIVTIARALKDKPAGVWDDSLKKLQSSNLKGISGMEKVYSRVQLSYDLLNDREAQSFFRLCCLFPEDYDIRVEKLLFYGWGLELFDGVDRLKEARDRVDSIIHTLKKSFLLLDGKTDRYVKLHDIVRDFAISISSKDEYPYLIRCGEKMEKWPDTNQYESCSAMSFMYKRMNEISCRGPMYLRCPNLKLLQLNFNHGELDIHVCEGTKEIRVVDLKVTSTLSGLTMQKKLRTLLINIAPMSRCSENLKPICFEEMIGEGTLNNLEIFSVSSMVSSSLPVEFGRLRNLRCLKIDSSWGNLIYIPPGIFSNLVKLEELELPMKCRNWGLKEPWGDRVNASLDELESLPLTSLSFSFSSHLILAEKIAQSIARFQICIMPAWIHHLGDGVGFDLNFLEINEAKACQVAANPMSILLRKCDWLLLNRVSEWKYIMFPCTYYSQLKTLQIFCMDSLEQVLEGPYLSNTQPCFSNLAMIEIRHCPKLKRLFPVSVAIEFTQLRSLEIKDCEEMEEIFYENQVKDGNELQLNTPITQHFIPDVYTPRSAASRQLVEERIEKADQRDVGDHVTVLPQLKLLRLQEMPKLRILYNGRHAIECPSLEEVEFQGCNNMEYLANGFFKAPRTKKLSLNGKRYSNNISMIYHLEREKENPASTYVQNEEFCGMKYLVDRKLLKTFLPSLEELHVEEINILDEIWLPCFSNLTTIFVSKCTKMKHLFPLSVAKELRQLRDMKVMNCQEMEEIFYRDQPDDRNQAAPISVQLSSPITSTPTTSNPKDEKSLLVCPTPNSFFRGLLRKEKQPIHMPTQIQTMEGNFAKLEEEEVDDVMKDSIILAQLRVLKLIHLSKLRTVYDGNHAIELPSLEKFEMKGCNKLDAISKGSFKAPKLEAIMIDKYNYSPGEDLNTIVMKALNVTEKEDKDKEDKNDMDEDLYGYKYDEDEDDDDDDLFESMFRIKDDFYKE